MPHVAVAAAHVGARSSLTGVHCGRHAQFHESPRSSLNMWGFLPSKESPKHHEEGHVSENLRPAQSAAQSATQSARVTSKWSDQRSNGNDKPNVLEGITQHIIFRAIVNGIVFLSTVQIGLEADYKSGSWLSAWDACGHFFAAAFTIEFLFKLYALRSRYFVDSWNVLDLFVAGVSVIDTWVLPFFLSDEEGSRLGVVRVFRLLRLLRIAKMMKGIPEFQMVVAGLAASMKAVFWIFVLLFCILYACAICCVEVIGSNESDYAAFNKHNQKAEDFNSFMYFGTVPRSLLSLLNMVFLTEWEIIVRPVFEKQWLMAIFLSFLVIVSVFGILNVIIGVVVERTLKAMEALQESKVNLIKEKQMRQAEVLADLAFAADTDGSQTICPDEMESMADFDRLQEMLSQIDLPYDFTFQELFAILDVDGDGYVSKSEFVTGVMRLIWCDDFQRDCLLTCSLGQIKQATVGTQRELQRQIRELHTSINIELETLRRQIAAAGRGEEKEEKLVEDFVNLCTPANPGMELATNDSGKAPSYILEQHSVRRQQETIHRDEGLIDAIPNVVTPIGIRELLRCLEELDSKGDAMNESGKRVVGFLPIVRLPSNDISQDRSIDKQRDRVAANEAVPLLGVSKATRDSTGYRRVLESSTQRYSIEEMCGKVERITKSDNFSL